MVENADAIDFCKLPVSDFQESIETVKQKRKTQIVELSNSENGVKNLKILIEFIRPETKLVMVGDNYDVNALVGIGKELGWEMYIVGRKKKVPKATFSNVKKVFEYEEYAQVPMDDYTATVLMSHDYNWDKTLLPKILEQKPSYVGMLGPKKRMQKMQKELNNSLDQVSFFYSPVGLDIGAESPEEIAISICSEIIATFRNRDGKALREREGTIHERETKT